MNNIRRTFRKRVREKELYFNILAASIGVSPTIIGVEISFPKTWWENLPRHEPVYHVVTQLYPTVLVDVHDKRKYMPDVQRLVSTLHINGVKHGDLSEDNVVVNEATGECRLIDFGHSSFLSYKTKKKNKECENELREVAFFCG